MLLSLKVNILTSFNSRTPGGVRRRKVINILTLNSFNSRTPGGVRRPQASADVIRQVVSIPAPREGCDAVSYYRHFVS